MPDISNIKICKRCHYGFLNRVFECRSPNNPREGIDVVTGDFVHKWNTCHDCRADPKACSMEGNWYKKDVRLVGSDYTDLTYAPAQAATPKPKKSQTYTLEDI